MYLAGSDAVSVLSFLYCWNYPIAIFVIIHIQTTATVHAFFRHMMLYPEVQEKCREEIHRVVGHSRLPALKDRDSLPYVEAIMKELFRWHPVVPSGTYI
jgi:cytochrome P450